ncbi:heavy-metal-associated domain-containing protein [Mesorhizobium marinum]|uniref:heavy-metal-associated domain-containing protein n=1 Tax=Mesorhizobium marinum TaxID=3228790 RepID=UPI003466B4E7
MIIHLKVSGIHCGGCANAIRAALAATPAVTSTSVDIASGRVAVETATAIDDATLIAAVEAAGYEASVER